MIQLIMVGLIVGLFGGSAAVAADGDAGNGNDSITAGDPRDPWEGFNRRIFWFNEQVDGYVLEPVARGWDWTVPDPVQTALSNFFGNLLFPIVLGNNLMQGKVHPGVQDVGRFAINTTIGVAGFFDPATSMGLPRHEEDFGQTLGWWGVGNGPYLVLPFYGPSTIRDGVGRLGDYPLAVTPFFVNQFILLGARTADIVNERSIMLEEFANAREAALDFYVSVRDAYLQHRLALVEDREDISSEESDDLYYFDEEE